MRLSELTTKIWMKIDPYYWQQKCRPLTVVSCDIRFMRIFAGVLWRGGIKRQWDNRKRRFFRAFGRYVFGTLGNEANIIIYYYLVPCRPFQWPQNIWPWMTLTRFLALNSVFAPVWLAETAWLRKIIAWKLIKIVTYCEQCEFLTGTLVSGNIKIMRVFAGVL